MSLFLDYSSIVYTTLNAVTGLTGIVSESLSDTSSFPKVWIEDAGANDWSFKGDDDGLEASINLHIGSRYRGTKELRLLMDKCHGALHNATLTPATGQCVLSQFQRHDIVTDSDGITRHGIMRFTLLISEVA